MSAVKYSVVVPAHNERDNIRPLVEELTSLLSSSDYEIILVDDNSSDGTGELCDILSEGNSRLSVVHRGVGERGMGYALVEGSGAARGEYVVWVMGDRSDKLETISDIVGKLDEGYDLVVASRYMRGGSRGGLSAHKAFYGSTYTSLARVVFGVPIHDITNAFRGFRREILDDLGLESADFAISPEFAIKAHLGGFRLGEVPTHYHDRRAGQTKFNMMKMGVRYVSLFRLRFTYCRRR
jgi:glycosyltransferase involved in cell wall biosynthesis